MEWQDWDRVSKESRRENVDGQTPLETSVGHVKEVGHPSTTVDYLCEKGSTKNICFWLDEGSERFNDLEQNGC